MQMIYQINSSLRNNPDLQDMETQASPSLVSVKQSDLRIVIDDFPEDDNEVTSPNKQNNPIYLISKMIEDIKTESRSIIIMELLKLNGKI